MKADQILEGKQEKGSSVVSELSIIIKALPSGVQVKMQKFIERILSLTTKAKELCNKLLGDWDFINYNDFLVYGPGDEEYDKAYQKVISNPEVSKLLNNFQFPGKSPKEIEFFKKKFFLEYFEDLIYFKISKIENKEQIKEFNINGDDYKDKAPENLKEIFNENLDLQNKKIVCLNLLLLNVEQLKVIFKNSQNWEIVDLGNNNLGNLDKEQLKAIFQNSQNWKSVYLYKNDLGKLEKEKLGAIFKNSQNWKSVYLGANNLGKLDKEQLKAIFQNSKNWKNVVLSGDNLGDLEKEKLEAIFENSQNWRSVDFNNNNLGKLDKEQLEVIFKNSQNWKSIDLSGNDFKEGQIEFIKNLLPNRDIKFN